MLGELRFNWIRLLSRTYWLELGEVGDCCIHRRLVNKLPGTGDVKEMGNKCQGHQGQQQRIWSEKVRGDFLEEAALED